MSCCGQKRAQLSPRQSRHSEKVAAVEDRRPEPKRSPRRFEYVGTGGIVLRGAVTGSTYRFDHQGDSVEVEYEDTFAFLAERYLRARD